jgi:hypothetical protein
MSKHPLYSVGYLLELSVMEENLNACIWSFLFQKMAKNYPKNSQNFHVLKIHQKRKHWR